MLERSWQLLAEEIASARNTTREDAEVILAKAVLKSNLKALLPRGNSFHRHIPSTYSSDFMT